VAELLTLEEAQRLVLERAEPLPAERVPLEQAAGRVLAEAAPAVVDLPPFPSSAMDGFAVRVADTPGTLPVVFRVAAGRPSPGPLQPGEAMGIATGGVVPEGADAVIPLEYVVDSENTVEIGEAATAGANVRPRAGDLRAGDEVVAAGTRLRAVQLGALAAAGVAEVVCGAVPRAAVLATGTELRRPGEPLGPGEVYEANGLKHDLLVTSGGVSVGPHDLVRGIEAELGVEEVFWRVAVKPGKPVSFGVRERTLVFGLPGNPVSSLVGFELFVRPAVLALQGHADPRPRFEPGRLAAAARRNPARDELVRARTRDGEDGAVELEPLKGQESHMIARAAGADVLVFVPRGEGELVTGSPVRYLRLA
jgi:molybdopterin molybdotransferase